MYLSILIPPPDRTKYMLSGHCCNHFCFVTFGAYIAIEQKSISHAISLKHNIIFAKSLEVLLGNNVTFLHIVQQHIKFTQKFWVRKMFLYQTHQ